MPSTSAAGQQPGIPPRSPEQGRLHEHRGAAESRAIGPNHRATTRVETRRESGFGGTTW